VSHTASSKPCSFESYAVTMHFLQIIVFLNPIQYTQSKKKKKLGQTNSFNSPPCFNPARSSLGKIIELVEVLKVIKQWSAIFCWGVTHSVHKTGQQPHNFIPITVRICPRNSQHWSTTITVTITSKHTHYVQIHLVYRVLYVTHHSHISVLHHVTILAWCMCQYICLLDLHKGRHWFVSNLFHCL